MRTVRTQIIPLICTREDKLEGQAVSAMEALRAARAAGVELRVEGEALVLEAASPPPADVIDMLSRHKSALVALLRTGSDGWSAEDWQAFFDERAAIAEFDGGVAATRSRGARFRGLRRRVAQPQPGPLGAGRLPSLRQGRTVSRRPAIPFGVEPTGHAWLHSRCWSAWHAASASRGRRRLSRQSAIAAPVEFPNDFEKNGGA